MRKTRDDEKRHSAQISQDFYRDLKSSGLEARTTPQWDRAIANSLKVLLPAGADVLDIGCGYGRLAIPLAREGFRVTGLDLSPDLIAEAKRRAATAHLKISFGVGNMTSLPYHDERFDAALCLWSAFNELLEVHEQRAALAEMYRILRAGGLGLLEGPLYVPATQADLRSHRRRGPEGRIDWDYVEGHLNPHFYHDETSLTRLCKDVGIPYRHVYQADWGGRPRLFLRVDKPTGEVRGRGTLLG